MIKRDQSGPRPHRMLDGLQERWVHVVSDDEQLVRPQEPDVPDGHRPTPNGYCVSPSGRRTAN